jgi:hypothetical protein
MKKKNHKMTSYAFFLSTLLLLSHTLLGQGYQSYQAELNNIEENTKWRIGPFRIFPTLVLRNIGYDNNVYRASELGNPVGDYTFTLSLPITTHLLFRDWVILSFRTVPEYVFFLEEERERSFNISYSPSIKMRLLKRFVLSGSYFYRQARVRASSEIDYRVNETRKETSGQIFYETERGTSVGFTAMYRDLKYQDIQAPELSIFYSRRLNRTEQFGQLEFYYPVFTDSFFFANFGLGEHNFDYPESKFKDSYSYNIYTGLQFPLLGRIRGVLSIGYKILEPYRSKKKSFSGPVGNVRVDYRLRRFTVRALYQRDCVFSFWTDNVFYIEDSYGAGLSFYMNQYIRLDYDFIYSNSYYPEPETIRLPDESYQELNREDDYISHRVGIVIRVYRSTGIGLMVTFWERDSNFPFFSREQLFIGGYLTYDF